MSFHLYILISSGSYALSCIPASSYPQVRVCLLVSLHPHILISSGSYVLTCILASVHPHILRFICACLHTCILTSSYPQIHVRLLVSSHPHIFISSGLCVLASMLTSSGQCVLDTNETQNVFLRCLGLDAIYKCFVYLMFNILFIFIMY